MSTISRRLGRFRALPQAERAILIQAWLALFFFEVVLHLLPFPTVQRLARSGPAAKASGSVDEERTALLLDTAARHHVIRLSCLRRALALQWLLGRQGLETDLRIGVRPDGGTIAAHAWVERDGRPVGQPPGIAEGYSVLLPGPRSDKL